MTENARRVSQSIETNPAALLDLTSLNHQPCLHVLHVDDDTFFLDTSKNILEMDGKFEVDIAASVDEALSKMKDKQFDVVVSDYEMPLKNGLQFQRELREQKNDVAFIMFTGRSREEVVVEALNLGADRFISKCGDPETVYFELAHAINTVVERKKAKKLLIESELKYRTLVESPLQGIAIAQGVPLPRIVFANESFGKILGYSTEELTSLSPQGVAQLIFKEDREVFFSRMKDRLTGIKAEAPLDFRAVRKDGSIVWFQVLSNCITFKGQPAIQGMFLNTTARVEAERKKRETEEKYKELANSLPQIVFEADLAGKLTFLSEQSFKITGYTREDLEKGMYMLQFVIPEQRERVLQNMKPSLAGNGKGPHEYTLIRRDGTTYPALVKTAPIVSENKVIGVRGVVLDITERKKAELLLREQRDKAEKYLNIVGNIIVALDSEGKITLLNKKGYEILGYNDGELKGKDWIETCLPAESRMEIRKLFEACFLEDSMPEFHENAVINKNGEKRIIRWFNTLLRDAKGNINGTLSSGEDITEQKKTEELLRESEEKFRQLAEESPSMIFINKQGKVVYANKKCSDTMGYSREEFYSPTFDFLSLIAPETKEVLTSSYKKHMAGEEVAPYEYALITKDGKRIDAIIDSKLIEYESENAILGIVTDITVTKQTENELREARERYSSLFDHAPLGILIVDPETARVIEFNDLAHSQLGYTREEFSKLSIPDFEANETAGDVRKRIAKIVTEGGAEFETKHCTKDGSIRNVLVTTKAIKLGGKTFMHAIFHDITEIRRVQDALMKSESKYRQLVELAQEGVWAFDNGLVTVFVNPRMVQMLGYSEGEMVGKSVFEFVDKDDVEAAKNYLMQSKQGVKGQFEYAFPRKDGTHLYANIVASNITDDQGGLIGTLALVADITERKQTEEALKESEERSRAIVANSPIGIATSGSDKRFLSANDAFCRILGYTEVELRKLTFKDVTRPEDLKESLMKMEDLDSGKISSFTLEKRYVKKDGSTIFGKIMVSAIRDETGKPNLFIEELEDISERKKKVHELKEERNKLEAITQSIGAGFGIMSKDYHVLWVNKFIKEYKGDVEGKLCYATLNDLDHVCPDCGVKKVFENGVSYDAHEYQSVDIKGNPYWVELIATPIKDEAGKVISAIEIAIDITEKKNLQSKLAEYSINLEKLVEERTEELRQTQAKLVKSERLAAIGELAAMIGHDLRNPLAGMRNAVYYLKKHQSTSLTETERKMFQVVDDCIDHSNKIIDDLLEYSRNVKLEINETTPKELLREALLNLEIPKTIQVTDLSLNEPAIPVDVPKMIRVFVNLLKNAFDAMPNGGSMRVVSRTKPMEVEIEFSDTGMGMSQETLNRIWTPLFTTKAKGMGFGLAICKRFVEAHSGRIIVTSEEGKGTTFIIKIPRKLSPTEA